MCQISWGSCGAGCMDLGKSRFPVHHSGIWRMLKFPKHAGNLMFCMVPRAGRAAALNLRWSGITNPPSSSQMRDVYPSENSRKSTPRSKFARYECKQLHWHQSKGSAQSCAPIRGGETDTRKAARRGWRIWRGLAARGIGGGVLERDKVIVRLCSSQTRARVNNLSCIPREAVERAFRSVSTES